MDIKERLDAVTEVCDRIGSVEIEPDELLQISNEIGTTDYEKVAKTVTYVRKRFVHGLGRYESFMSAFPERCVVRNEEAVAYAGSKWGGVSKGVGEPLSRSAIEIKAKRLENTKLYTAIVALLQTSLYVSYAIDRMKVLDKALEKVFDDDVSDRNRVEYMKVFLQETRKPESSKDIEVNVSVQNNDVSINRIEQSLGSIAKRLEGMGANDIIDIIEVKEKRNGNE